MGLFSWLLHSPADAESLLQAPSIHDLTVQSIEGAEVPLSIYRGKALLIVNTASRCGFTSQYKGLENLYDTYRPRGFEVLGFPSNDFMGQEPGSNDEIKSFCEMNFDVSFPLFAKGSVRGDDKQPLFRRLTEESGDGLQGEILWNFEKFLVDREGRLVARWRSMTTPESDKIVKRIEEVLAAPVASP